MSDDAAEARWSSGRPVPTARPPRPSTPPARYRYRLSRTWDPTGPVVAFVMLNPSTADAEVLDPTVRRCVGFARGWGFGSLEVVNLFAFRATDPRDLLRAAAPVGAANDRAILDAASAADRVVVAWGTRGTHLGRATEVAASAAGRARSDLWPWRRRRTATRATRSTSVRTRAPRAWTRPLTGGGPQPPGAGAGPRAPTVAGPAVTRVDNCNPEVQDGWVEPADTRGTRRVGVGGEDPEAPAQERAAPAHAGQGPGDPPGGGHRDRVQQPHVQAGVRPGGARHRPPPDQRLGHQAHLGQPGRLPGGRPGGHRPGRAAARGGRDDGLGQRRCWPPSTSPRSRVGCGACRSSAGWSARPVARRSPSRPAGRCGSASSPSPRRRPTRSSASGCVRRSPRATSW